MMEGLDQGDMQPRSLTSIESITLERLKKYLNDLSVTSGQTVAESTIIETAIQILEKQGGFKQASTREIVTRSGFSVGSIYRYFSSKEDIYSKIWVHFASKLNQCLIVKLEAFPVTGNVKALMTLIVDHYMQELKNRRPEIVISIFRIFIKNAKNPEMKFGETLVLNGLRTKVDKEQSSGVPILQDFPLLQYFFKKSSTTTTDVNIITFITLRRPEAAKNGVEKMSYKALNEGLSQYIRYDDKDFEPVPM